MEEDLKRLLEFLAKHGGKIINSNDLHHDLIAQARASNRMYVDENSLGYIWEPAFAGRFPTTEDELKMFDWCYPIEPEMSKDIDVASILKRCEGEPAINKTVINAPLFNVNNNEVAVAFGEWLRKQRPDIFHGCPTTEQLFENFKKQLIANDINPEKQSR